METHVAGCSTCNKAADAAIKFRRSIHMYKPVYKAPPELKATIRAVLRKESKSECEWFIERRRPLFYAAVVVVLSLLCVSVWMAASHGKDQALIAQAISDLSRSLLSDRLLDVTSPDQHTVKLWFTGKLDYSLPVADLAEAGCKLLGGRLDILENRRVAAIVYRHQDYFINVFVWPAANREIDFEVRSVQGFSVCAWNKSEFNYLIVSELNQAGVEKFEDRLRDQTE
jgi:anti-sigma factor RsiW